MFIFYIFKYSNRSSFNKNKLMFIDIHDGEYITNFNNNFCLSCLHLLLIFIEQK